MTKYLIVLSILFFPFVTFAGSQTIRDSRGRYMGRIDSTPYGYRTYDRSGSYQGKIRNGYSGYSVYNRSGRYSGRISLPR